MPRGANFYYSGDSQLGPTIGALVSRALFGDPELRMQAELQRAQMDNYAAQAEEARLHGGLYQAQTRGVGIQNDASTSLPALISSIVAPAPAPAAPAAPVDPLAPLPEAAPPAADMTPQDMRPGLGALMAAMAQMQGDKVDPNKVIGGLAAMFGNDELARRGVVAQGTTPGEKFALTPERADDIAQAGYDASYRQGTDVARINHASDMPIAQLNARTTMRGQDIESADRRRGQNIDSSDKRYATDVGAGGLRTGGWAPRFSAGGDNSDAAVDGKIAVMQQRLGVGPDQPIDRAHLPQVFDAIAVSEGGGRSTRNNNPGNIIDGPFARAQPGYAGADAQGYARFASPEAGRQAGISLLNVYYKRGQRTIRDIVEGLPATKPGNKAPPQLSSTDMATITGLIQDRAKAEGMSISDGAFQNMRTSAAKLLQKSGNPADAVDQVFAALKRNIAARQSGGASSNQLRQQAIAAIRQGADPAKVKARFKSMTGTDLTGV